MTIIAGFKCRGGIVLCADSLESDGITKRLVPKIWAYQVAEEWGIAIASAGDGDFADSFNEQLEPKLGNGDFDEDALLDLLRTSVDRARRDYPRDDLGMLIGIWSNAFPPLQRLYRVFDKHLGPVMTYQTVGCGAPIADFICSQIFTPLLSVEEAERLGILALARTKDVMDGCGGPTRVASFSFGQGNWKIMAPAQVVAIEAEFGEDDFRTHLQEYWKAKNPVSDWPTGYRWLSPRIVPLKKQAKLNTILLTPQKAEEPQ